MIYETADAAYKYIVDETLQYGMRKPNRTGVDTLSTFGIHYNVWVNGHALMLTTKQMSWKNIVVELLWFMSGTTSTEALERHGCKFWEPWTEKAPSGKNVVLAGYGPSWRHFGVPPENLDARRQTGGKDQLRWLVRELNDNPMSRRLMVSAWDPFHAQTASLPPCHCFWGVNVQFDLNQDPMLCLHLTQRSCDVGLGVPYNMASYGLLLAILARLGGLEPGYLSHTLLDCHIYTSKPPDVPHEDAQKEYDHVPVLTEQVARTPKVPGRVRLDPSLKTLDDFVACLDLSTNELLEMIQLVEYESHPPVSMKVAV